jgi:hypothetical protein
LQRAPQKASDRDERVEVDDERRVIEDVGVPVAGLQNAQRAIDDLRFVDADGVRHAVAEMPQTRRRGRREDQARKEERCERPGRGRAGIEHSGTPRKISSAP